MFVMHFYFVCNMNKIVRCLVVYILVLTITGAVEITSNTPTSTTSTKWTKPKTTTRWKEPTTITKLKETSTTARWREPTTTTKQKEPSTTRWHEPTTINKGKYITPTTTTRRTEPTATKSWKKPTTAKTTTTTRPPFQSRANHGMFAVASFSGVDSRNGRLSPMSGIKIYPPIDSSMVKSDDKGNFIFKSVNGKMPMPITITKQGDGVSGTIRILPGSVSVSSSASSTSKSGPATAVVASYNPWSTGQHQQQYMKPIMNDIYFPPFPTFPAFPSIPDPIFDPFPDMSYRKKMPDPFPYMRIQEPSFPSRMQDPWFNKNMYKQPQLKHDMYQTNWFYPTFNPYNYWR